MWAHDIGDSPVPCPQIKQPVCLPVWTDAEHAAKLIRREDKHGASAKEPTNWQVRKGLAKDTFWSRQLDQVKITKICFNKGPWAFLRKGWQNNINSVIFCAESIFAYRNWTIWILKNTSRSNAHGPHYYYMIERSRQNWCSKSLDYHSPSLDDYVSKYVCQIVIWVSYSVADSARLHQEATPFSTSESISRL